MAERSMIDAALWYAEHDIPVFPITWPTAAGCSCGNADCKSPAKHPLTPHGFLDASTDTAIIRKWWRKWARANIGMRTGLGRLVVDGDPRNGGPAESSDLVQLFGAFAPTAEQRTGGGGRHWFFTYPGGKVPDNIGPGVDLKGDAGYVLVAPSLHMSGARYEFDGVEGVNALLHPADAPAWLLERIKGTNGNGNGNGHGHGHAAPVVGTIPKGTQHKSLMSIGGSMRKRGCEYPEIEAALLAINETRLEERAPDSNIRAIAGSVCKYPPGAATSSAGWHTQMIVNREGAPKPLLANAITALRMAPEWAGVLAYNEFSMGTVALKPAPWPGAQVGREWTDHEDRLAANWLQHAGICVQVEVAGAAVQTVAKDQSFHPVRAYLEALRWDGTKRLDTWLSLYLGADTTAYTAAVGARWLVSGVARIFQPGAKVDTSLILEGLQGSKKSTGLATMAGKYFTDEIAELGSKDASLQTRGVWIIELAELDSMTRGEVSKIKAFMSRSTDRFRPPYGKRLIESPRQCIFAGSVNHATYLRDETGGRRFWPVACTTIRIDELARDRDQLWAEAVVRYRAGSPWWLDSAELNRAAEMEQSARYDGDPWDSLIARWTEHPSTRMDGTGHPLEPFTSDGESVTVVDVLTHCIGKRQDQWTQQDRIRVARCLCSQSWERYRERDGNNLTWRYRRRQ
jgi:predicted P-loop ATPase